MIYLLVTCCVDNKYGRKNEEHRKKRYIDCISNVLKLLPHDINPVLVDGGGERETYLDSLGTRVIYTNNNLEKKRHKGVNELEDIKKVIDVLNIKDEDMIIKLTGRYKVLSGDFFSLVKKNIEHDGFIKRFNVCTKKYDNDDCVLGMYAIKCKHLKNFEYRNFKISPEKEFSLYTHDLNMINVEKLHLECCFADNLRLLVV